ncbi:RNA polymerase sigma factor RpoD [bioreactor metagenome]|uniref:RNA polymerase sigma factor RpoD n=1 Tax=bioreactor metagenome TaxID=1076179 RepID=A0A645IYC3_9ZZZZ
MHNELNYAMKTLSPDDYEILNYCYGLNGYERLSHEDIANQIGLSVETIRELEARALRRLRHPKRARRLFQFVDRNS